MSGIINSDLTLSLSLLLLFLLVGWGVVNKLIRQRNYREFRRPDHFDANILVIGAGSAGLVAAYVAAALRSKVILVEKNQMGGDCLNTGCVPSKTLLRAAKAVHDIRQAGQLGINVAHPVVDFQQVMARVREVISRIEPNDSVDRYTAMGVDCLRGEARILSPWQVEIGGERKSAKNLIIATGASPLIPDIPGLESINYLTSESIWNLTELPEKLLVVGTGPIGCELGQAFQRLGSQVTLAGRASTVLPREDEEVSAFIANAFVDEGMEILCEHQLTGFESAGLAGGANGGSGQCPGTNKGMAIFDVRGQERRVAFDRVILALGRKANTADFGLEQLGISLTDKGTVEVDKFLRTGYPNISACGDVAGPYQYTHAAAHQAWYAVVNALFGQLKKFKVDYSALPRVTFTSPEVAQVGLGQREASDRGIEYEITRYNLADLDRAITENTARGFVKVLTVPNRDKILGVSIVGEHAGEQLAEFTSAMKNNLGLNKVLGTVHPYPTMSEANKFLAGQWRRDHTPKRLLYWVEKYHRWVRGR